MASRLSENHASPGRSHSIALRSTPCSGSCRPGTLLTAPVFAYGLASTSSSPTISSRRPGLDHFGTMWRGVRVTLKLCPKVFFRVV
eukprot:3097765-Pyramimonas_sp.AAC.1